MNNYLKKRCITFLFVLLLGGKASFTLADDGYDPKHGEGYADIVIPFVVPAIYQSVSPTAGDATLVIRIAAILANAWFDASAPYHSSAVGVYSRLGRRPASESTDNENINVATIYASFQVLNSLLPQHADDWREMLISAGLDPDNESEDLTTPIGIGNVAGKMIVKVREHDGMNQLGDEGGRIYNLTPYADYLNYEPVNSAQTLIDPSRWQPAIKRKGLGIYTVQNYVTPQLRVTKPYSYKYPRRFRAPFPYASQVENFGLYKEQADKVLEVSASLDDFQKMSAELFDDKLRSLATSGQFAIEQRNLSLLDAIHYEFVTNIAEFDTGIAIWHNKYKFDAVRPFSAIKFIYSDEFVTAWGGPNKGTVSDLPASQWQSYLGVADHPEYPSATAGFCGAHAQASRLFLKSDDLGWTVDVPKGTSRVEPRVTPANDIQLSFETWTDFETVCGISRLWAGVHFEPSIPAGQKIGRKVARKVFKLYKRLNSGG